MEVLLSPAYPQPVGQFFPSEPYPRVCRKRDHRDDRYAHGGCIGFFRWKPALQHDGLMLRALQYVKAFDGLVINQPLDLEIGGGGLCS